MWGLMVGGGLWGGGGGGGGGSGGGAPWGPKGAGQAPTPKPGVHQQF